MLPADLHVLDDFPPADMDAWRKVAEAALKGAPIEKKLVRHLYEGIDLQPVYTIQDALPGADPSGLPGQAPFVRGTRAWGAARDGWDLRQEYQHPDLQTAQRAIQEDLQGGVNSLRLVLDLAGQAGLDGDDPQAAALAANGGLTIYQTGDLRTLLEQVDLEKTGVNLQAGAAFLPAAALLASLWEQRSVSPAAARGAFNADPLGFWAADGELPVPIETTQHQLVQLAAWTCRRYPQVTSVGVDTSVYHLAGATASQDLAFALATALEYLRAMTSGGLSLDQAAGQMLFHLSLGTHHFLAAAKLRTARRLWTQIVEDCGGSPAAMRVRARMGHRVLTQRDPHVNVLRNTTSVFAAGLAGADVITSVPFDEAIGLPSELSRRIARNTALILQDESQLHRVVDPAGGSWFLERLTEQLAEQTWAILQEIERQGGMLKALESGWVADQIDVSFAERAHDLARRKIGITGVSEFPNPGEERMAPLVVDTQPIVAEATARLQAHRPAAGPEISATADTLLDDLVRAAGQGASLGQLARALGFHQQRIQLARLPNRRWAQLFEKLRDASDAWLATHGQRPRVFLVNLGSVAQYTVCAAYAKNFFEAGGFEVLGEEGFAEVPAAAAAFAAHGASLAVVCSSDAMYQDLVAEVAPALKQVGARCVILAGRPGDHEVALREAGVDRFIFMGCNVLETLQQLLAEEGVLTS